MWGYGIGIVCCAMKDFLTTLLLTLIVCSGVACLSYFIVGEDAPKQWEFHTIKWGKMEHGFVLNNITGEVKFLANDSTSEFDYRLTPALNNNEREELVFNMDTNSMEVVKNNQIIGVTPLPSPTLTSTTTPTPMGVYKDRDGTIHFPKDYPGSWSLTPTAIAK